MGNISDLMVNETRESLFQLECIATSLDNKAYGIIAFNTILLSVFAFSYEVYHSKLIFIPSFLIIASLISVLICIVPRSSHRMTGEKIINLYGEMDADNAAGQLALNYASLEKELNGIYDEKYKYLRVGLLSTLASVIIGFVIIAYLIFDP